jgi:signal transduction histidine kinase
MRQVQHTFDMTLEARVGERTRIARELHDTLLQSFHGLLLRFQTASYLLPERRQKQKRTWIGRLNTPRRRSPKGRSAVQGLRASTVERNDLAVAIRTLGDELATETNAYQPSTFDVAVEGDTRALHPVVRDEIYRIAAEALRNAFRHAHAGRIEVEMHYDDEQFRLRVRDNGRGIDKAAVASHETAGHFGLRGMPSARRCLAENWPCGAKSTEGQNLSCAFLPTSSTSQSRSAPGGRGCWQNTRHVQKETHRERRPFAHGEEGFSCGTDPSASSTLN